MPNPLAQFRSFVACCPQIFDPYFRCDGSDAGLVTLIGGEAFFCLHGGLSRKASERDAIRMPVKTEQLFEHSDFISFHAAKAMISKPDCIAVMPSGRSGHLYFSMPKQRVS